MEGPWGVMRKENGHGKLGAEARGVWGADSRGFWGARDAPGTRQWQEG